jgi:hypothetical protein
MTSRKKTARRVNPRLATDRGKAFRAKKLKLKTYQLKCVCIRCGMVARTTAKWLVSHGAPFCGLKTHGRMQAPLVKGEQLGIED